MDESDLQTIPAKPGDVEWRRKYAAALRGTEPRTSEFLEAEIFWSQSRTACSLEEVERLANGLDPEWVFRVSRPPVGVCCDHIEWKHGTGDRVRLRVTEKDLAWLESRFEISLPADYRAFLRNYNGGVPVPGVLRTSLEQERAGCNRSVSYLCSMWEAAESSIDWDLDLVWRLQQLEGEIRHRELSDEQLSKLQPWAHDMARRWRSTPHVDWITIGAGAPTGELEWFCLDCGSTQAGRVFCVDPTAEFPGGPDHCLVANSFREFLAMIGAP